MVAAIDSDVRALVTAYNWPSQSFWRYFELRALRALTFDRPILEIGAGDGEFSAQLFAGIEEAIDINPAAVERSRHLGLYGRVRCMDARDLHEEPSAYGTVFANCVLEHIPEIDRVLAAARTALRPGGRLVATVPLLEMNNHLLIRAGWYADLRRSQLVHTNLLSEEGWKDRVNAAGFTSVHMEPYLRSSQIRFWDSIDTVGCVGFRRYRLSAATRVAGRAVLPRSVRCAIRELITAWLYRRVERPNTGPACAVLIIAA